MSFDVTKEGNRQQALGTRREKSGVGGRGREEGGPMGEVRRVRKVRRVGESVGGWDFD